MNHFFALELSDATRRSVAQDARQWRRVLSPDQKATWYSDADYHVTLKFLGDLPETVSDSLVTALSPIAASLVPFDVTPHGTGAFPNRRRPNVLWVGVVPSTPLTELAMNIETALEASGYPKETRPYRPHITVARCRSAHSAGIWDMPDERLFPVWAVNKFALMQTLPPEQRQNGLKARYNTVHLFPFGT